MNYRSLGRSGLKVPELCFGTGTFGGSNEFFKAWGSTQDKEAAGLIDICMEAGCNFFDTADGYSDGQSEIVLGKAIAHLKRAWELRGSFQFPDVNKDSSFKRWRNDPRFQEVARNMVI